MLIPAALTLLMAWKTKDVDSAYSESLWIFGLIAVQIEVLLVGAPVVAILRDVSMNGRYIGYVILLWTFPMSTLIMLMCPKMFAYYKSLRTGTAKRKRGARSDGQVSGISSGAVSDPASTPASDRQGAVVSDLSSGFGGADRLSGQQCDTTNEGETPVPPIGGADHSSSESESEKARETQDGEGPD